MSYTEQNSPRGMESSPNKNLLPPIVRTYLNSPIESPRGGGMLSPRINAALDMSLMSTPDIKNPAMSVRGRPHNISFD